MASGKNRKLRRKLGTRTNRRVHTKRGYNDGTKRMTPAQQLNARRRAEEELRKEG